MANLKNITDLPMAESTEGLNLIVNDNGAAKQIAADKVGRVKSVNGAEPDDNGNVEIEIPEGFSGSWNDLTDKPFYTEEPVEVEVVAETTVTIGQDEMPFGIIPCPILKHGQEYIVNWNGVQYTCQAIDLGDDMIALGNGSLFGFGDLGDIGNNEPFFFIPFDEPGWYGVFAVQPGTYTVSMKTFDAPIHHLDPKYIKDMYYEYMAPNTDEVMQEQTVMTENDYNFVDSDGMGVNQFLTESATYIVTWNGTEYTCIARKDFAGNLYIGNQAIAIEVDDWPFPETIISNEPFFFYTYEPEGQYGLCIQNAGEYTVSIYGTGEKLTPHKIDVKYMPYEIVGELENHNNWISNLDNALSNKMNKSNPSGTGYFSLNRKSDTARGQYSFAEGYNGTASGYASHAEGVSTVASGSNSHAEGNTTTASGKYSHAEGEDTTASGERSHAEGLDTTASGYQSHAEGFLTTASNNGSHAEGSHTVASGAYSHAEGYITTASGNYSHASGYNTIAKYKGMSVSGKYNIGGYSGYTVDRTQKGTFTPTATQKLFEIKWYSYQTSQPYFIIPSSNPDIKVVSINDITVGAYIITDISKASEIMHVTSLGVDSNGNPNFSYKLLKLTPVNEAYVEACVVGNGTSDTDRSNAHTLDWDGNAWFAGDVYVGSTSGTNKDEGSRKLIPSPATAQVGQTIVVKTVDANGKPTDWECVDMASSGGDIPEALPNPHALTLTGAVEAEYDGSQPLSVEIPEGEGEWTLLDDLIFSEETVSIWEYEYEVDEVKEIFIYTNGLLSNETFGGIVYVNGATIGPSGSLPAIVEEGVSHTRFYAHYVGGGWLSSFLNYRYDSLVTGQQSFKDAMGPVDTNIGVANKIVIRAGYGSDAARFKGGSMKIYVR